MQTAIDEWINKSLKRLTDKYVWPEYTAQKTLTPASGVIIAPPSFQGMIDVVPTDDTFGQFSYLSAVQRRGNRMAEPYYMDSTTYATDGYAESSVSVTNGATTLTTTGSPFVASDVGKALLIGNNGYEYEITARADANNITFSPAYRGATSTYRIVLRPAGVRTFTLYDESDTLYAKMVYINYKKTPQELYNDYDRPLIDADEAIKLGALIEALRNEKYMTDAERLYRDYEGAVADARQSTVRPPRTTLPRGMLTPLPPFSFNSNRVSGTGRTREF
jgi:hypothetical protein